MLTERVKIDIVWLVLRLEYTSFNDVVDAAQSSIYSLSSSLPYDKDALASSVSKCSEASGHTLHAQDRRRSDAYALRIWLAYWNKYDSGIHITVPAWY